MRRFVFIVVALVVLTALATPCHALTVQNQTTCTPDDGSGDYLTVVTSTFTAHGSTSVCGGFNRTYQLRNQSAVQCLSGCANNFFQQVNACSGFPTADCCNGALNNLLFCLSIARMEC